MRLTEYFAVRQGRVRRRLTHLGSRRVSGHTGSATNSDGPVERHLSNVPQSLRACAQWACWTYIHRNGTKTKCPINPRTGRAASSTDPSTWATFEQAVTAFQCSQRLAGVGFVFSADDAFAGIDLDNCIDARTGDVKPWARSILDRLDSYSEISPSGKGVKVFVLASNPGAGCRTNYEDGAVELYDRGRFFAVTGAWLPNRPTAITTCQSAFNALRNLCGGPTTPSIPCNITSRNSIGPLDKRYTTDGLTCRQRAAGRMVQLLATMRKAYEAGDRATYDRLVRPFDSAATAIEGAGWGHDVRELTFPEWTNG